MTPRPPEEEPSPSVAPSPLVGPSPSVNSSPLVEPVETSTPVGPTPSVNPSPLVEPVETSTPVGPTSSVNPSPLVEPVETSRGARESRQARSAAGAARSAEGLRLPAARTWLDIAVLVVLALLGVIGFEPPFGGFGFLLAGLGGLLVGTATGVLASMLRLNVIATTLAAVAGYFVLGTAFAVPGQGVLGVIPTLESLASLAIGAAFGWADIVTLQTPIGAPEYIAVVPYVATWVVTLVAASLATRWLPARPRAAWRHGVMLIGPVLLYLAGILTGTDTPYQASVRGVTFAVIALVWLSWRRTSDAALAPDGARRLRRRKLAGTAILVVAATLVGGGAAFVIAPPQDQRFVLREEIEPPFDPLQFPSPLAGFRQYSKLERETALFTVDGLQPGDRVRLATMDSFSGKLWNVTGPETQTDGSGSFALVGRDLPSQDFITPTERDLTFEMQAYDDVWLPSMGYPEQLDFLEGQAADATDDLRYNVATGTSVLTTGLEKGDRYRVRTEVQRTLPEEELAAAVPALVTLPPVTDNPDIVTAKAQEFAGGATEPAAQLEAIRLNLFTNGFLSHGLASDTVPSRAGHGADRIDDLLSRNQMIGDEEQYASAFALMASAYGYPARVVMGFKPDVVEGRPTEVLGENVTAWVEVAFDDIGWVAYDPTPEETDIPQDQIPRPQIEPQPQVRQPPRAENEPEDLLTPVELDEDESEEDDLFAIPGWLVAIGIGVLALAAIVFAPLLIIAAIKTRRARRRRTAGTGDRQVAGAWDELLDRYGELGFTVPSRSTRGMVADRLLAQLPKDRPVALAEIAAETDDAVFAGRDVPPERSDKVWTESLAAVEVAQHAVTRARRIVARYRIRRRGK